MVGVFRVEWLPVLAVFDLFYPHFAQFKVVDLSLTDSLGHRDHLGKTDGMFK